jgi:hypothetical protein
MPLPEAGPSPSQGGNVRVQRTPLPEASALLPDGGIDKERQWLRETLAASFDATSDTVVAALRRDPGCTDPSADMVTDGQVVQLYLSSRGTAVDEALRSAAPGPHVPVARSVLAGLTRLPSHQGIASYTVTMTAEQAEYYRQHHVVTDWASATPSSGLPTCPATPMYCCGR